MRFGVKEHERMKKTLDSVAIRKSHMQVKSFAASVMVQILGAMLAIGHDMVRVQNASGGQYNIMQAGAVVA